MRELNQQENVQVSGGHDSNASFLTNAGGFIGMVVGGVVGGLAFDRLSPRRSILGTIAASAFSAATTCVVIGMGKGYVKEKETGRHRN